MGRNVLLLYMSIFNKNPKIQTQTQTNEGAVRYLIEEGETPDCILALCSERVRKEAKEMPDGSTRTTLEYFRDSFLPKVHIPAERLVVIEVPDSMDEETQFQAISQLLEKIETEDTLFVDLSGGLRDVAMLLVIAARCMRDLRKVQTRRVIYAELRGGESIVRDRTQLYGLFDFVTAMDQFFSTGTAQKLENYLRSEGEKDPVLHTLLTRINQFSEDLALCRVRKLNDDLNQIAQALKETPKKSQNLTDLFFQMLKDRFSTEFAELLSSGEKALPALVSWCAGHGMYQQALTLLCEQMPEYVCQHLFVQPTPKGWDYLADQKQNRGKPWVYPLFHFHFCRLTLLQKEYPYTTDLRLTLSRDDAEGNMLFGVANDTEMHDYLDMVLASDQLVIDPAIRPQLEQAALHYQCVMQYRNQINHASANDLGLQSERVRPLDTEHIKETLQKITVYLHEIRPLKRNVPQDIEAIPVDAAIPAGTPAR
ncbi:TM1812 family CRISPR-associated protein [Faecalibacterium sp. I4-1-79]|uniref:TM1812 family CRISPR-associated protein n=1 Tax=Faecalibacterium sp. I4-1-79 TaxID=2929494 RepID=UPI0020149312|nr:TM1812 family CRISPR-associated protein [Faecalibacterium sp. I4-1-79]UQK40777.1 TM1812 family CRISPR-associated protein [Faecalibacterium sp. I4-1-79]